MLTGRESLVRLIGRRRRSPLPASLAAVLSPSSPSPSASLAQADDGGGSGEAAWGEAGSTSGGSGVVGVGAERVVCPVCGDSIRGSDYCVNTHLDMCLTRGTKRKLTQSTLLNFRFSKKVSAEPTANNLNNEIETENMKQIDEDLSSDQAFVTFDSEIGSSNAGATISSPTCLNGSLGISETITSYAPSKIVLPNVKDAENDGAGELPTVAISCSFDECAVMDSSTVVAVDTVIVGRRFHENIELREDAVITFLRDPQNAKDPDAIKVLYAGSECEQTLGYLPRDLAKVLAPLVDKHYVECEGFVVGLHEQQFGNVPIQITIQKCKSDNQINDDPNYCQSLWENFVTTVKSENFRRPRSARYQTNFNLMMADVMANHAHVFSDIEKSFLASFKSLSDDGQRLFVRIYTRKGPWFRKSSISYQEISDLEHAVMELKLAGYIDMLSCTVDPSEYDMKEILDVLSVPEMKEILKELPKDNTSCTRRHELVSTLLSSYHNCASLPKRILKWTGTCIRISKMADELLWRIQRLFFLNGDQDLSSFLLVEFGVVKFPDYVCSISHRIFQERSDLLDYEDAIRVAQVMD
ncbi:fanconi-associated nuclease 1 homolog, partial [Miscanthus floridulus]|uniref:fanconi-associated nuclease 1 homolog n=1 Tax=Miscanthus floridulus TaxID=154761 RepID=UPI0034593225